MFPPAIVNPTDSARIAILENQVIALRTELLALKDLITAAQKFDRATGQEECESEEKIAKLKNICDVAGIDLSDIVIFPKSKVMS